MWKKPITWFRGKMLVSLPNCSPCIKRRAWLKLLGVTVEEIPGKWDLHFEEMLKKILKNVHPNSKNKLN